MQSVRTIFLFAMFLILPGVSFANPIVAGVYGRAGLELYLFIPTIIIEYVIILLLLRLPIKLRLLGGVIRIHLITYPLTVFAGVFAWYLAEAIPLLIEPEYYIKLFGKYQKRGLLIEMPNERKVWRIVIIANLVTFALGLLITSYLQDHQELTHHVKANQMAAYAQIELLSEALDKYKKDVGHYPSTVEGLNALIINPGVIGWNGPYLKKIFIPNDPWLIPYQYRSPGVHADYDLFSYGADKAPSGEGFGKDITSWDEKKGSN